MPLGAPAKPAVLTGAAPVIIALGRAAQVSIRYADDGIWLGGHAVTCVDSTLDV